MIQTISRPRSAAPGPTRWRRLTRPLFLAVMLATLAPAAASAHGNEPWIDAIILDRAEAHDVSSVLVESILHCESGHYATAVYTAQRPGSSGELGIAQILPPDSWAGRRYGTIGSLFESRYGWAYGDVWSEVDFLAWAIDHGYRSMWHC